MTSDQLVYFLSWVVAIVLILVIAVCLAVIGILWGIHDGH
jgi:hypothetical protein